MGEPTQSLGFVMPGLRPWHPAVLASPGHEEAGNLTGQLLSPTSQDWGARRMLWPQRPWASWHQELS